MIRVNLQTVPVTSLRPNPWNPNKQSDFIFEKECQSIRDNGFIDPVLVREKAGALEIIDGEHRWRAAMKLGMDSIPVNNLGEVDDSTAKKLTIIMNETRGKADIEKLSELLSDLDDDLGMEDLLKSLPYHEKELEAMIKESEVDWDGIGSKPASVPAEVVGGDTPPPTAKDLETPEAATKLIKVSVDENLRRSFFEQMERINKILSPNKDISDCDPAEALSILVKVLERTDDLNALLIKGLD
jgi:hypothetical protein